MRTPAKFQVITGDVIKIVTSYGFDTQAEGIDTYSGVRFAADGQMYAYQAAGGVTNIGSWLVSGTNSDYYLVSTIDSGSLDTDPGRGPLQLNSDRSFNVIDTTIDGLPDEASVTFTIEDVATTDFAGPTQLSFYAYKDPSG